MNEIYSQKDLDEITAKRKKFLTIFYVTLAVVLAVNIAIFVVYTMQEFNTPLKMPLMLFNIISCSIYAAIYYVAFAIKFRQINSYYKLIKQIKYGLKDSSTNAFSGIDNTIVQRDGVDFISLIFMEWSDKDQCYYERKVLMDMEKPIPDFKKGDMITHITQGNVLVAYTLGFEQIFE